MYVVHACSRVPCGGVIGAARQFRGYCRDNYSRYNHGNKFKVIEWRVRHWPQVPHPDYASGRDIHDTPFLHFPVGKVGLKRIFEI